MANNKQQAQAAVGSAPNCVMLPKPVVVFLVVFVAFFVAAFVTARTDIATMQHREAALRHSEEAARRAQAASEMAARNATTELAQLGGQLAELRNEMVETQAAAELCASEAATGHTKLAKVAAVQDSLQTPRCQNWAVQSAGATIDRAATTPGVGTKGLWVYLHSFFSDAPTERGVSHPPKVVLDEHHQRAAGRCFSLPSRGKLTVRLAQAVRLDGLGLGHMQVNTQTKLRGIKAFNADTDALLAQWNSTDTIEPAWGVVEAVRFEVDSDTYVCIDQTFVCGHLVPVSVA